MINKRYRELPMSVHSILLDCQAWLTGSGARYLLEEIDNPPPDWDLLIPPTKWLQACRLVALEGLSPIFNSFGGLKVDNIDMWPGTVDSFLTGHRCEVLVRLNPYTVVRTGGVQP